MSALTLAIVAPTLAPTWDGAALAQGKAKAGQPAQAEPNITSTTVADNTYGTGGTKTTQSITKTYEVITEEYKDRWGITREKKVYPLFDGEVSVFLYDDKGATVATYDTRPADSNNPKGEWRFTTDIGGKKTAAVVVDKATADARAAAASAEFAKHGGLEPLVETNVQPPVLGAPRPANQSRNASGGQTSAPSTCGEITDQATLAAMGCTPAPARRPTTTVNRNPAPAARPAASRSQDDCINNIACEEEVIRRALERGSLQDTYKNGPMNGMPAGGQMPGGVMPGGMPVR